MDGGRGIGKGEDGVSREQKKATQSVSKRGRWGSDKGGDNRPNIDFCRHDYRRSQANTKSKGQMGHGG